MHLRFWCDKEALKMKKQIHYAEQLVVRVSRPLKTELESAAQDDGRVLSNQIRKILIDFAAARVLDREAKFTGNP
jgi:hypothetical protein